MESRSATCLFCGDAIGQHELVVVIEHEGGERETSLAREPELPERGGVLLVHSGCAHTSSLPA